MTSVAGFRLACRQGIRGAAAIGYARLVAQRLEGGYSALDLDTGGGEVLDEVAAAAGAAGLVVTELRSARCRMVFHDVGAIVRILRKCVWWALDFSVQKYLGRLLGLDRAMRAGAPFVATTRHLIQARR